MNNPTFDDETDNESVNDLDDTDDDIEYEDVIYEPEEVSKTKYNIVHCVKLKYLKNHYIALIRFKQLNMDVINDYSNIYPLINPNKLRLEIAECIYLSSGYCVAIIKTFWLKLIQRKWKKIYQERKICLSRRANPNALKYKEIHGTWPLYCLTYPLLKGMLRNLTSTF